MYRNITECQKDINKQTNTYLKGDGLPLVIVMCSLPLQVSKSNIVHFKGFVLFSDLNVFHFHFPLETLYKLESCKSLTAAWSPDPDLKFVSYVCL